MPALTNPTDLARETLRLLTTQRIAPTPENYQRIYSELSGVPAAPAPVPAPDRKTWSVAVREITRHLAAAEGASRKSDGVERLLAAGGSDPNLPGKLVALIRSWGDASASIPTVTDILDGREDASSATQIRDLLAQTLDVGVAPRLERYPDLADEARLLAQQTRAAQGPSTWARMTSQLRQFWIKVELRSDSDGDLLEGLLKILALLVNNMGELVDEDQWVSGQMESLRALINQPLSVDNIVQLERGFKDVVYKQGILKHSLREAKTQLKGLLGTFVERLGEMTSSASDFNSKIERYGDRLQSLDDIAGLRSLLDELMADTRAMQVDVMRRQEEFIVTRKQAEAAERRVRELEAELTQVSEQVREDQLTGALNRRGLEDAMERETARAIRHNTPLCVAVLDLDNFKRLNDTYGHQAGDAALIHLTKVVRRTVRPTDVLARYGGEEFVILLGDANPEQAQIAMNRLQRELTKRFFLHNNERLLITFSAGIALHHPGEPHETVIARADKAMYQAKIQGKNRVVIAEPVTPVTT
ncbi:MAG: GGDEF domain-containing protein [Burkholderiales bacterium]